MNYVCCTEITRRNAVKAHPFLNGIDFLEVLDNDTDPFEERQTILYLHFLKPLTVGSIAPNNIVIEGGERIKHISVVKVTHETDNPFPLSPPEDASKIIEVKVSKAGDFSTYTLRLVNNSDQLEDPLHGFDPILSIVDFSFKVNCPTEFDCKPIYVCPPKPKLSLNISYLAKDYASFRQLMLDRMALLIPEWQERNPADLGIVLVELLAYVGDYLSYQQDAIATEAYLNTARKRISLRRHARLVDYFMHDGCNARTWLQVKVISGTNGIRLAKQDSQRKKTHILSKQDDIPTAFRLNDPVFDKALKNGATVFEILEEIDLYSSHNEMYFHEWGKKDCCLPHGATKATLIGHFPKLKVGNVIILAEKLGPETGKEEDADKIRRHPVRLTSIKLKYDTLFGGVLSPITSPLSPILGSPPAVLGLPITEIEWEKKDALPFPLCISNQNQTNISVAWGNILLIDHGFTMEDILQPPSVPDAILSYAPTSNQGFCEEKTVENIPARYRPKLLHAPLTQSEQPIDLSKPATLSLQQAPQQAMPNITLAAKDKNGSPIGEWLPKRDLLNSVATSKEFVVEIENDGTAYLRFGDGEQGERPESGTLFIPTQRIGNGKSGNVGAEALTHLVTNDAAVLAVIDKIWNPLPTIGGTDAEQMEEVRQFAPEAFRTQKRAVTSKDYEFFAENSPLDVQRAAATFRWTGSWKTVFLTIDRLNGEEIDSSFEQELRSYLEPYRMAGFDLEVDAPLFVSLEIELSVCVNSNFFASNVKQALLEVFSNTILADGRMGVFHPDNFSFGQPVYLSQLYAVAQNTEGVDSVRITKFRRQGSKDITALETGKLLLGRREIARCDNDRNFQERGVFNLIMKGGR